MSLLSQNRSCMARRASQVRVCRCKTLLDYLEGGETIEQFFTDYPRVKREQAIQFLELGKDQLLLCVSS